MRINRKKEGIHPSGETSKKTNVVFEVFKNDLMGEWLNEKKDISELDEHWMLQVSGSGRGKQRKNTPIIPLIYDEDNIPNDDDYFFVA